MQFMSYNMIVVSVAMVIFTTDEKSCIGLHDADIWIRFQN